MGRHSVISGDRIDVEAKEPKQPTDPDKAAPKPVRGLESQRVAKGAKADPWGIRRAEVLLTSLKGVLSVRVVANGVGEITEIHVLTEVGLTAKQVVRNVESALLAHLGLKVDHRKISVAQTAEVLPIEAMEERAITSAARKRGVVFKRVEVTPVDTPHRVKVTVTLSRDGEELAATELAGDAVKMRILAAARATVSILDSLSPESTIDRRNSLCSDARWTGESSRTNADLFCMPAYC